MSSPSAMMPSALFRDRSASRPTSLVTSDSLLEYLEIHGDIRINIHLPDKVLRTADRLEEGTEERN